jgi:hypothetical protein
MLKTIALGIATAASLSLGTAAVTPAFANYAHCLEAPSAADCQAPAQKPTPKVEKHAHNHHSTQKG